MSYIENRIADSKAREFAIKKLIKYLGIDNIQIRQVLDIGAGRCEFINQIHAKRKFAIDLDPKFLDFVANDVNAINDTWEKISEIDSKFDVIWCSNFIEHLNIESIHKFLDLIKMKLNKNGKFFILCPNFAYSYKGGYFNDWDHRTILTHISLYDLLAYHGFRILYFKKRILPLTVNSKFSSFYKLTWLYLRLPIRPKAAQMIFIVSNKEN